MLTIMEADVVTLCTSECCMLQILLTRYIMTDSLSVGLPVYESHEFTETVNFIICCNLPWFFTCAALLCRNP